MAAHHAGDGGDRTMLATSSSAIFPPRRTSPDFGPAGVLDRSRQAAPAKALVAADGWCSLCSVLPPTAGRCRGAADRGRAAPACAGAGVPGRGTLSQGRRSIPRSPSHDFHRSAVSAANTLDGGLSRRCLLMLQGGSCSTPRAPPVCPVRSSTEGAGLRSNTQASIAGTSTCAPRDRVFWFHHPRLDDVELVGQRSAAGATAVLYDGSPFHPGPDHLADRRTGTDHVVPGVSAKHPRRATSRG